MRPLPALLLALLLVIAVAFPVAGAQAPPERTLATTAPAQNIDTVTNTTNQLSIPESEVRQASYNDTGIDVGSATEAWSAQLQHRQDGLSFEERFQRTSGSEARTRLVTDRLSTIESKQEALEARQNRAIARYARGEISASAFLRARLVVNAEASELLETVDRVDSVLDTARGYSPNQSVTSRLGAVEGEFRTLTGPVGTQLQSGEAAAADRTLYIEVSEDGYMLATVTDDGYVRETHLSGSRDASAPDQFLATARDDGDPDTDRLTILDRRAEELYPWMYSEQRPSLYYYGDSAIYELTLEYSDSELRTYLDGGTTDVFHEEQVRDLADVPTTATERAVNDTLAVTVRQSTATGPLLVTAANNETDSTIDGTVTINGQPVGSTGDDGALWTVEPRGTYTVTVTADGDTTSVVVQAN